MALSFRVHYHASDGERHYCACDPEIVLSMAERATGDVHCVICEECEKTPIYQEMLKVSDSPKSATYGRWVADGKSKGGRCC